MPGPVDRRPYRVLFRPAASGQASGPSRRGTIVAGDLDRARAEARAVIRDGGTAEIVYVDPDGGRHLLAVYTPERPPDPPH